MSRPLEDRFPTLYHNISHESPSGGGAVEETRTPKDREPNLNDVISLVLEANRVHPSGPLVADLVTSVNEFLAVPEKKKKTRPAKEEKPKEPDDTEDSGA